MKMQDLQDFLKSLTGCVSFEYNNTHCGIDPINAKHFDVWYGNEFFVAESMDEVMSSPFFDKKCLLEIFNDITEFDY